MDIKKKISGREIFDTINELIEFENGYYYDQKLGIWKILTDTILEKMIFDVFDIVKEVSTTSKMRKEAMATFWVANGRDVRIPKSKGKMSAITFKDGTLLISDSGEIEFFEGSEYSKAYRSLISIPFNYNEVIGHNYKEGLFYSHYSEIVKDVEVFKQLLGSLMFPLKLLDKATFIKGPSGNGKSILLRMLSEIYQPNQVSHVHPTIFNFEGKGMASLEESLLNLSDEVTAISIDEGPFKIVIGCEKITLKKMYQEARAVQVAARHIYTSNEDLVFSKGSQGILRRVAKIETSSTKFDDWENLIEDTKGMIAYIVNECIQEFINNKFNIAGVKSLESSDPVNNFVVDVCELVEDYKIPANELYEAYKIFCEENNEKKIIGKISFNNTITSNFNIEKKKIKVNKKVVWGFIGIKIR